VFPHSEDRPTFVDQQVVSVAVAKDVELQLRAPPISVRSRPRAVLWAAVPEAAVHEDRYPHACEGNVDRATGAGGNRVGHPEAQAGRVK
jgi:hypothetical protein